MRAIQFFGANDIFSLQNILINLFICLSATIMILIMSKRLLQILQLSGYSEKKLLKWAAESNDKYYSRMVLLVMLSAMAYLILTMALSFLDQFIVSYIGLFTLFLLYILFVVTEEKRETKVPLKFTARMKRLYSCYSLLVFLFVFGVLLLLNFISFKVEDKLYYQIGLLPLALLPVIYPILLVASAYIMRPFENWNKTRYIKQCKRTLENNNAVKVGITGSFGKTSVKEIAHTILSEKFNVVKTPASYNTPMGLCISAKELKADTEMFLAEMGARHIGDIKELCDIVKPDYAVITGVNNQHLETFLTVENIVKTKYELIEGLKPDGIAVFSGDNPYSKEMYGRCQNDKVLAGLSEECFITAKNIKLIDKGSVFDLAIGETQAKCSCKLIGRHNITNVLLAAGLAFKLGMDIFEIALGISKIESIPHRLQLIEEGGIRIVDDSYNSNKDGAEAALNAISEFKGRKIIVTPGMIELGESGEAENKAFGEKIAKVFEIAVLVGTYPAEYIKQGLLTAGFLEERMYFAGSLNEAKDIIAKIKREGDIILFENDLPDNY